MCTGTYELKLHLAMQCWSLHRFDAVTGQSALLQRKKDHISSYLIRRSVTLMKACTIVILQNLVFYVEKLAVDWQEQHVVRKEDHQSLLESLQKQFFLQSPVKGGLWFWQSWPTSVDCEHG